MNSLKDKTRRLSNYEQAREMLINEMEAEFKKYGQSLTSSDGEIIVTDSSGNCVAKMYLNRDPIEWRTDSVGVHGLLVEYQEIMNQQASESWEHSYLDNENLHADQVALKKFIERYNDFFTDAEKILYWEGGA